MKYARGDRQKYGGVYNMNMRLLPNVIQKVVINMGNGTIAQSQQLDEFEPLNDFRKRRRQFKLNCGGLDPRMSGMNELWEKKLTISMHIEDKGFKSINSDGVDWWEFTYQQVESATMSQFEFDKINSKDEIDRNKARKLGNFPKGNFWDFDFLKIF